MSTIREYGFKEKRLQMLLKLSLTYSYLQAWILNSSTDSYHTEKKTHVVWPLGQNGRDS